MYLIMQYTDFFSRQLDRLPGCCPTMLHTTCTALWSLCSCPCWCCQDLLTTSSQPASHSWAPAAGWELEPNVPCEEQHDRTVAQLSYRVVLQPISTLLLVLVPGKVLGSHCCLQSSSLPCFVLVSASLESCSLWVLSENRECLVWGK